MGLPVYINDHKERYMTGDTNESEQQANREKYALLKEFHRTLRQTLSGAGYKVFCAIEDWSESKGECWHSQSTIADACDLSIRSVNASVKQLEALGLVETRERAGQSSTYIPAKPTYAKIAYLRDNLRKNCIGGYAKSAHLPTQNLRINVSNNNGSNNNVITTTSVVAAPPPKSTLIDLVDTGSYQEKQPEPEPKPKTQPKPHAPYPPSNPIKAKPDVKVRDKPAAATLHPALKVYQDTFKLLPQKRQFQAIIDKIGDAPDVLGEWGKACYQWNLKPWKPGNIAGLLNYFEEGNYKNELSGKRNDRGRSEQANRHPGKATANGTAVPGYWDQPAEDIEREWAEFKL